MTKERPSWDEYFVNLVIATSDRSSCLKRDVGALIIKDKRILTTGYNGSPRGIDSCVDSGECMRRQRGLEHGRDKDLCKAVHAEANAIYQAARYGIALDGSDLWVTTFPCPSCAKAILSSGIISVHYLFEYYGEQYNFSKELLEKGKINLRQVDLSPERLAKLAQKKLELLR